MFGKLKAYYQNLQGEIGQGTLQGMIAVIILVFIAYIIGDKVLCNTSISRENNSLTKTALDTLMPVVLIAAGAGIILRLF